MVVASTASAARGECKTEEGDIYKFRRFINFDGDSGSRCVNITQRHASHPITIETR